MNRLSTWPNALSRPNGRTTYLIVIVGLLTILTTSSLAISSSGLAFPASPTSHLAATPSPSADLAPTSGPSAGGVALHTAFPSPGSLLSHPGSWQGAVPPGSSVLAPLRQLWNQQHVAPAGAVSPATGSLNASAPRGGCFGVWPGMGGQDIYANDCYGHDEPGINFYSSLPGSGGNVTWNVTLPVSTNSSSAQGDLYPAIWFGMTLSDPLGWWNQCFLELQFYPDSSWSTNQLVLNHWVGAAVAWQIEAATGYEDPCYYQPLLLAGGGGTKALNMTGGDQIVVTMTGYASSPYGENISVSDLTSGAYSSDTLYDYAGGFPLNPAYTTSTSPNSLQWTPGGELPVSFAFEIGHAYPPYPSNNSYGGCSPGAPGQGSADPSAPCPSYDPGSWAKDTVSPWHIQVPTFFNATATETPSQVSFTSPSGGISFVNPLSNNTCNGRLGGAWCSYPWYSYACGVHAFEFGAVDYTGVSADFDQYLQFAQTTIVDTIGGSYFPPTNYSIPTCHSSSYSLTVAPSPTGSGSVPFLTSLVNSSTRFGGLGAGEYSVGAIPAAGENFVNWTASGGARVVDPESPQTTVWLSGSGSLTAHFSTSPAATSTVTFDDLPSSGAIAVFNGTLWIGNGTPIATVASGGHLSLTPGFYSVVAYPPSGYNFTSWSVTGGGASLESAAFPLSWLLVPGSGSSITVTANYAASTCLATLTYYTIGNGRISFNGGPLTNSSSATVAVGTYPVSGVPGPGAVFRTWLYFPSALLADQGHDSNVSLENGSSVLIAEFAPAPAQVHVESSPLSGGTVSFAYRTASANQSLLEATGSYPVIPLPSAGYAFTGWSVDAPANLSVTTTPSGGWLVKVNASGNLTAHFALATTVSLGFETVPAIGGQISFSFQTYSNGSVNSSLTAGTYYISALANPGFKFAGWQTSGPIALNGSAQSYLTVSGSGGVLAANFSRVTFPVTFTATPTSLAHVVVNGIPVTSGATIRLTSGLNQLQASLATGATFVSWSTSPGLSVSGTVNATLNVSGAGTVSLLATGFSVSAGILPSGFIDLGQSVSFWSSIIGNGTFAFSWVGLPGGCSSSSGSTVTCTPLATGIYSVGLFVNSSDGIAVFQSVGTLSVAPALSASQLGASPSTITLGLSSTVSLTTSGGQGPVAVSFGWPTTAGCLTLGATALTCTPTASGTFAVSAIVSDVTGATLNRTVNLTVNPPPAVSAFTLSGATTDVGLPVDLTVSASGGTGALGLAYTGLPPGCSSADSPSLTCTPSAAGVYNVSVTATDQLGVRAVGPTIRLTVNPLPTIGTFVASAPNVTVNKTVSFSVSASGGTGPLSFTYANLPAGCVSSNASTLTCSPSATGNYTVTVTVHDVFGVAASATTTLRVDAVPPVPPTPPGPTPSGGWTSLDTIIVLIVVVAIVVVALAVLLLRRRPPAARAPPSEAPEEEPAPDPERGSEPPAPPA